MNADATRRHAVLICFGLLLALVLRLGVVLVLRDSALELSSDAKAYHDIAANLAERGRYVTEVDPPHTLDKPYANRPPMTPWLLAATYSALGTSPLWGQLLLTLIGVAACLAVYSLGAAVFGRTTGLLAGLLAAMHPFWTLLAAVPLTESVAILLYPLMALAMLGVGEQPTWRRAAVAGAAIGVVALNKPTILGFLPLYGLWLLLALAGRRRRALAVCAVGIVAAGLLITPWTIRNYAQFGRVIPVMLPPGYSMWEANNPWAEYPLIRIERGETWMNDPRAIEQLPGLPALGVADWGRQEALAFVREHPATAAAWAFRRFLAFWGSYDHRVLQFHGTVVLTLFLAGLGFAWRDRARSWRGSLLMVLLIAQTAAIVLLLPSMPRYRIPVEPFMLVFAAHAFVQGVLQPGRRALLRAGAPGRWRAVAAGGRS